MASGQCFWAAFSALTLLVGIHHVKTCISYHKQLQPLMAKLRFTWKQPIQQHIYVVTNIQPSGKQHFPVKPKKAGCLLNCQAWLVIGEIPTLKKSWLWLYSCGQMPLGKYPRSSSFLQPSTDSSAKQCYSLHVGSLTAISLNFYFPLSTWLWQDCQNSSLQKPSRKVDATINIG